MDMLELQGFLRSEYGPQPARIDLMDAALRKAVASSLLLQQTKEYTRLGIMMPLRSMLQGRLPADSSYRCMSQYNLVAE